MLFKTLWLDRLMKLTRFIMPRACRYRLAIAGAMPVPTNANDAFGKQMLTGPGTCSASGPRLLMVTPEGINLTPQFA